MSTITVVAGLMQTRANEARGRYRSLVDRLARGEEVLPEDALEVLESVERSCEELDSDVAHLQRRYTLARECACLRGIGQELREIDSQIFAHDAELEEARRRHEELTQPLELKRANLRTRLATVSSMQGELLRGASPGLRQEIEAKRQHLGQLASRASGLRHLAKCRRNGVDVEGAGPESTWPAEALEAEAEKLLAAVVIIEAEVRDLETHACAPLSMWH